MYEFIRELISSGAIYVLLFGFMGVAIFAGAHAIRLLRQYKDCK